MNLESYVKQISKEGGGTLSIACSWCEGRKVTVDKDGNVKCRDCNREIEVNGNQIRRVGFFSMINRKG